jgi:hypothetical protein
MAGAAVGFAQPVETVGTRALGMGGAFVAVADDPSATIWNPAGLSIGDFAGAVLTVGAPLGAGGLPGEASDWPRPVLAAVAMPALGVSYVRRPLALSSGADAVMASSLGVTLLQSLSDAVVVGSTLRWTGAAAVDPGREVEGGGRFDADIGVLIKSDHLRVGATVWNLRRASFEVDGREVRAARHVRAGAAVTPTPDWAFAVDVDLTRTAEGPREASRRLAAGVERWWLERRVGLRGGVRASLHGSARPVGAGGVSLGLRPGVWVEGQFNRGGDLADHSWGIGVRVGF